MKTHYHLRSSHKIPLLASIARRAGKQHANLQSTILTCLLFLLFSPPAISKQVWPYPGWNDSISSRKQAKKQLDLFNMLLLSGSSATRTLLDWCRNHHLTATPKIIAIQDKEVSKAADASILKLLNVQDSRNIGYRRVKLVCGDYILSEADNWYVKSRLSPAMNATLQQTDTPFGIVVKPLGFTRKTLAVEILWHPLPSEAPVPAPANNAPHASINPPDYVLKHQAVLYDNHHQPFSVVIEMYRNNLFRYSIEHSLKLD